MCLLWWGQRLVEFEFRSAATATSWHSYWQSQAVHSLRAARFGGYGCFVDPDLGISRAYLADHYFDDPSKVRRGRLVFGTEAKGQLVNSFERLWALASPVTLRDLIKAKKNPDEPQEGAPEPGPAMKEYALDKPVVHCKEAANAKGISLENELKTLLLTTPKGFVALHLPGDAEASLRKVKNALETREASMASLEQLATLGLRPGTVCAIKDPIWSLPHLISKRVLQADTISTNSGTQRAFIDFTQVSFLRLTR